MLNYIIWNVSPYISDTFHFVRWYGLFFAIGFYLSYCCALKVFQREGLKRDDVDTFAFGIFIFLLVGLRLGHCLFYEPDVYLSDPVRILKVWEGGLASHGGGIGLICAFLWFSFKTKKSFWWLASRVVLVLPITAFFVRMGNLMNSEIYGVATTLPWGFVFVRDAVLPIDANLISESLAQAGTFASETVDSVNEIMSRFSPHAHEISLTGLFSLFVNNNIMEQSQFSAFVDALVSANVLSVNHPTQIYEALTYLVTAFVLLGYYQIRVKRGKRVYDFVILGVALLMIFVTRFCYEFIKNDQVDFEQDMVLNMGQLLSIPFILGGIAFLIVAYIQSRRSIDSTAK